MENEFLSLLREIADHPAARGLADDAALLDGLVFTHDMLVEGVHFLASDPPATIAWKLIATNLSDLAAKGAQPVAALMGAGLNNDAGWNAAFVMGLGSACEALGISLIGGDTVAMPGSAPRSLGLTAIGRAGSHTPSRSCARAGNALFVVGAIGDAGLGLQMAKGAMPVDSTLLGAYLCPIPLVAQGRQLAPLVSAMMDVSDGLLIDASRLAEASGVHIRIDLDQVPRSIAAIGRVGADVDALIQACTAGDDYALLFTADREKLESIDHVKEIGEVMPGSGLSLYMQGEPIPLPERLGWLHD